MANLSRTFSSARCRDDKWNGTLINSPIFCGAPAVTVFMEHRVDGLLQVRARTLDFQPNSRGGDIRREFGPSLKMSQSRTCSRSATGAAFTWNRPGEAGRRLRKRARSQRNRKQKSSVEDET